MWIYAVLPFCLQVLVIGCDEFVFHLKRGLPKWERIGHPLDTLSVLFCLLFPLMLPFNSFNLKIYIAMCAFSCFMITKDEFIHKEHCPGAENWLHALLFILHPISLLIVGLIWPVIWAVEMPASVTFWFDDPQALRSFLSVQSFLVALFFLYQLIFWNIIWKNRPVLKL